MTECVQPPTVTRVIDCVCNYFHVDCAGVVGHAKWHNLTLARHVCMYLIRRMTKLSYKEIAAHFGRDHATVIHAVRRIERMIASDESMRKQLVELWERMKFSEQF